MVLCLSNLWINPWFCVTMTSVSKKAAAFLILLSIGVYANTLANGFVYDDIPQIVENDALRMPIAKMFWAPYGTDGAWRPVAVLIHAANLAVGGLRSEERRVGKEGRSRWS